MFPDRKRRSRSGFSLIEMLIVVTIIMIILTVAVPKLLKAIAATREMAAVKAITTIHTEEVQYLSQYGQYATSLTQLGPPTSGSPSANGADLIDKELAAGEKGSFKFTLQPSQTNGYVVTAIPVSTFGITGGHTYYSDQSMGIHQHSGQEPASASDPLVGEKEQQTQQPAAK
jgi:type IV pilus assembly protein PilA